MKNLLISLLFLAVMLTGCGKNDIVESYEPAEDNDVLVAYHEMSDGTWKCGGTTYPFRLELSGRMPNAAVDSFYVVLTDNSALTFEDVTRSIFGSSTKDSEIMNGSVIVEMG